MNNPNYTSIGAGATHGRVVNTAANLQAAGLTEGSCPIAEGMNRRIRSLDNSEN
jgi:hypothetical protein